jgi:branched-chain amino acid transport system permease protein
VAAGALDPRAILKELGATALVVGALTVTMVGFDIKDVPGGIALQTRFMDVVSAIVVGVIGRGWLILLRERRPRPVVYTALPLFVLLLIALLSITLFGPPGRDLKTLLPFKAPIVQWMMAVAALGFGIAAVVRMRRERAAARGPRPEGEQTFMDQVSARVQQSSVYIGVLLFTFAAAYPFMPFINLQYLDIGVLVLTYVMLGWGLNIVVGLAGLLDLGYVAFYAVGAYSFGLLASPDSPLLHQLGFHQGLSFWICLPIAGVMAASAGVTLGFPVLRLRGDYLAIVTLGFGEMIRVILTNFYSLTKGPDGLSNIPPPSIFGYSTQPVMNDVTLQNTTEFHRWIGWKFDPADTTTFLFYIILLMALITNFFTLRVRKLPIGRAWEALREDEIACRALGINPTNTKLTAFGLGAMFGGFAGSFFATRQTFISPESFTFIESAVILAIVVLGGFGSQIGVVVAAFVLIGLPELFRELQQYRMLFFGASMVFIMLWRPRGLLAHREPTIRLHKLRRSRAKAEPATAGVGE